MHFLVVGSSAERVCTSTYSVFMLLHLGHLRMPDAQAGYGAVGRTWSSVSSRRHHYCAGDEIRYADAVRIDQCATVLGRLARVRFVRFLVHERQLRILPPLLALLLHLPNEEATHCPVRNAQTATHLPHTTVSEGLGATTDNACERCVVGICVERRVLGGISLGLKTESCARKLLYPLLPL